MVGEMAATTAAIDFFLVPGIMIPLMNMSISQNTDAPCAEKSSNDLRTGKLNQPLLL